VGDGEAGASEVAGYKVEAGEGGAGYKVEAGEGQAGSGEGEENTGTDTKPAGSEVEVEMETAVVAGSDTAREMGAETGTEERANETDTGTGAELGVGEANGDTKPAM
jgi:hypothetical protein